MYAFRVAVQVGGFLQRLDYVRKYAFGVICILKNDQGQFPIRCSPSKLHSFGQSWHAIQHACGTREPAPAGLHCKCIPVCTQHFSS